MEDAGSVSAAALPVRWAVWRIDDNGNTFVVRSGLDRAEAGRRVVAFTARGHRQTYRAERETTGAHRSHGGIMPR